jgi:hypothetical protein
MDKLTAAMLGALTIGAAAEPASAQNVPRKTPESVQTQGESPALKSLHDFGITETIKMENGDLVVMTGHVDYFGSQQLMLSGKASNLSSFVLRKDDKFMATEETGADGKKYLKIMVQSKDNKFSFYWFAKR